MGALDFNRAIPGMIEPGEQQFLFELTRDTYTGVGEIVEIGALAGLSTSCLAEGLRQNPRVKDARGRIHVYDNFTIPGNDLEPIYRQTVGQAEGWDFRNVFDFHTSEWREHLVVHPGDASLEKWCGLPIEILFIDCAVGEDFHRKIAREFYPWVIPHGFLIHQDWFYNRSGHLPALMRGFDAELAPIWTVGTSKVFMRQSQKMTASMR
jgi:hypothetical protein